MLLITRFHFYNLKAFLLVLSVSCVIFLFPDMTSVPGPRCFLPSSAALAALHSGPWEPTEPSLGALLTVEVEAP